MPAVLERIASTYNYLINDVSNPITKNWLLMSSPFPLFAILVTYNIFCIRIGPMLMKNRPPYNLDIVIKLYNIFQVIISSYIFYEGIIYLFSGNFNFQCEGHDDMVDKGERIPRAIQVYFLTKLLELIETIFFVLRKSNRQITFLHLYHHTIMPIGGWICLKYFPGGQLVIVGTINSLIHLFMYIYYLLSAMGPQYKKYLWWKQYMTIMQLAQFAITTLHSFNSLFHTCSHPIFLKFIVIIQGVSFYFMFTKFYYQNYILNARLRQKYSTKNNKIGHVDIGRKPVNKLNVNDGEDYVIGNSNSDSTVNVSGCKSDCKEKTNESNNVKETPKRKNKHL